MKTFAVNGTEYKAKAFDFNLICDLEDMGISIEAAGNKPMSLLRAYFGLCAGKGREYAGKELEAHIINGGTFEEIMEAMSYEMDKSDFFQSQTKTEEEKTTASSKKSSKKAE